MEQWNNDDPGKDFAGWVGWMIIFIIAIIAFGCLFWYVYFDIPAKRKGVAPYLDSALIFSVDLCLVKGGLWGTGCETDARRVFKNVARGTILGASIVGGLCCYAVDLLF